MKELYNIFDGNVYLHTVFLATIHVSVNDEKSVEIFISIENVFWVSFDKEKCEICWKFLKTENWLPNRKWW